MNAIRRIFGTPAMLRRLTLASLIANIGIVVTGGAVRLTGSGLGCPTWPRCDAHSYIYAPERGYHAYIEFGNRTLISVVGTLAALSFLAVIMQTARPARYREQRTWAILVLVGIAAQAILGGVTTRSGLNPWVVASHFLVSTAVIAAAYQLWARCRAEAAPPETATPGTATPEITTPETGRGRAVAPLRTLVWAIVGVTVAVLVAGTITTGSGPHAGDEQAKRTGLNPETVAQLHADLVMLLIGLSVAAWFAMRVTGAPAAARAAGILVAVELSQALIGFVQYFTSLPIILVGAHMLGACLVWVAALNLLTATRSAPAAAVRPDIDVAAARTPERV